MPNFRHFFRNCGTLLVLTQLIPLTVLAVDEERATGVVYEDRNGNGLRDSGEPGVAGVLVSNQVDVVTTDEKGRYQLPLEEETTIFLTKPAGCEVPLNVQNLPQFYYIHQPKGSPEGLKFRGVAPTGPLPQPHDFPLVRTGVREAFSAIISGDPHLRNEEEVGYFRNDVVARLVGSDAAFYMALGDIASDDLDIYDQYNRVVAQIGIPAYNVYSNHDVNFRASDDRFAGETFKRVYGPPFYSFDYGKVHFVVLDNVDYQGWDSANDKRGTYRGFLDSRQLKWLKNDLSHVPLDRLIVLAMHIAIHTEYGDREDSHITNRKNCSTYWSIGRVF